MNTRTTAFAALFTLATAGMAAEPAQLTSIDPLTLPAPQLREPLFVASDSRLPAEKILPSLWERATRARPTERLGVIVSLHEPERRTDSQTSEEDRTALTEGIAKLEHEFVQAARDSGFRAVRGLSQSAIVIGDIAPLELAQLAAIPAVKWIEFDLPIQAHRLQGGNLMRAHEFRTSLGATGSGVAVAIVDSGVSVSSPELSTRVTVQGDFTGTAGSGTVDGTGHGTAVAGIVAGTVGGMAPQATIWALKVFDGAGNTQESWILAALDAAYQQRNNYGGLDVVNMSLGAPGPYNSDCDSAFPAWAAKVNQLVNAGIPVIVSSGNDTHSTGVGTPACLSNAISVGAVYDANIGSISFSPPNACSDSSTAADKITCYSNSGVPLDMLAPSHCAETVGPEGVCFGGTSASAPYVSGVVAQILSLAPGTTPTQLKAALQASGIQITDPRNGISRHRIDAIQAYQSLSSTGSGPCVQNATTLCLLGDRFEVKATYTDYSNNTGSGHAVELTPDSGYFWFFDASNVEAVGKVVSFCPVNGSFGFYAGGLTDVGVVMTVRDTVANQTQTFTNNRGHNFNMISSAFNTCQ